MVDHAASDATAERGKAGRRWWRRARCRVIVAVILAGLLLATLIVYVIEATRPVQTFYVFP